MKLNGIVLDLAGSFKTRLKGLIGTTDQTHGLILTPCSSIHTFGMKFPIDVLFYNSEGILVKKVIKVKPNRIIFGGNSACTTIEIPSTLNACTGLETGTNYQQYIK